MYTSADGWAAKVLTERDDPTATVPTGTFPVLQARDENGTYSNSSDETINSTSSYFNNYVWPERLDHEHILSRIKAGYGEEIGIPAHEWIEDRGNQTDGLFDWDYDEENEFEDELEAANTDDFKHRDTPMDSTQHPPILRSIHERKFTPLLKRATIQTLQDAQAIVESATAESSELNLARLARPLRNTYGLKPGTIVGGNSVSADNVTTNQNVGPLLQLTDAIIDAAALVAESSAVSGAGNITKRAVAATGTFWMGSIARQGTVPWGDDPAYKVFRNVVDYGAVGDGITVCGVL